ncbi:hypothetical protein N7486_005319 [Penicillium sp. IBT 16267x]|nr:hypothetical protein N7486_005319 [Penicillium sp. IBT 16267x]
MTTEATVGVDLLQSWQLVREDLTSRVPGCFMMSHDGSSFQWNWYFQLEQEGMDELAGDVFE